MILKLAAEPSVINRLVLGIANRDIVYYYLYHFVQLHKYFGITD